MVCRPDERASRTHSWAKRIRVAAAIVTIVGGIPSALVTVALVADWAVPLSKSRPFLEGRAPTGQPPDASWEDGTWVCRPSSTLR
jgi:hypothetical protein